MSLPPRGSNNFHNVCSRVSLYVVSVSSPFASLVVCSTDAGHCGASPTRWSQSNDHIHDTNIFPFLTSSKCNRLFHISPHERGMLPHWEGLGGMRTHGGGEGGGMGNER